MNDQKELKFKVVDKDGRQLDCEALFMFESPETKKNYIVYTDNSLDEEGNTKVYASIYNPASLKVDEGSDLAALELSPIETDKEWKIIETILEEAQKEVGDSN